MPILENDEPAMNNKKNSILAPFLLTLNYVIDQAQPKVAAAAPNNEPAVRRSLAYNYQFSN